MRIGVILPAYNEDRVIAEVLSSIPESLSIKDQTYAIQPIVINDMSTDDTSAIANQNPQVIVVDHLINSGAGAATRTGLRYLRTHGFDYGATMDSDGQHDAADLINVLKAAITTDADLVIGSRLVNKEGMPLLKVIGNKGLGMITRVLLGVGSSDSQSGLKAFNRKTIETLSYNENGYAFCSELLWRASQLHLKIIEVPIKAIYTDHSKGKGQSNWNGFQIVKQLIKHRIGDFIRE